MKVNNLTLKRFIHVTTLVVTSFVFFASLSCLFTEYYSYSFSNSLPYVLFKNLPKNNKINRYDYYVICLDPKKKKLVNLATHNLDRYSSKCSTGTPLMKQVIAIPNDYLVADGWHDMIVNHKKIKNSQVSLFFKMNPAFPRFKFKGVVPKDYYLVLGTHEDSFDSRYLGLVHKKEFVFPIKPIF